MPSARRALVADVVDSPALEPILEHGLGGPWQTIQVIRATWSTRRR